MKNAIAFTPIEIGMRDFAGLVSQVEQEGGDRVWYGGALCPQHAVASHFNAADEQICRKIGGVENIHFQKEHGARQPERDDLHRRRGAWIHTQQYLARQGRWQ